MPLLPGQPAPWFIAPAPSNPQFVFDTAAGRYVLLLFLPPDAETRLPPLRALAQNQRLFDDARACAFVVFRDAAMGPGLKDVRGLRWLYDGEGAITERFGPEPNWTLLDPTLRVIATWPVEAADEVFARIAALPPPGDHAGTTLHAPVLVAPRILEPALCEALIGLHDTGQAQFSGVMRDAGDRTVAVMDDLKKRRDVLVTDPELEAALRERLERRLFPMIARTVGFRVTRIERYVVSCYDADEGGVFHPHRDNTTLGTAHRKFACSINLNDDFEGGDLRFGEFGPATYRPPVGGAVVFSCGLMHEALPVRRGRRFAFLPFLYDEAGQSVLEAYRRRVAEARAAKDAQSVEASA